MASLCFASSEERWRFEKHPIGRMLPLGGCHGQHIRKMKNIMGKAKLQLFLCRREIVPCVACYLW